MIDLVRAVVLSCFGLGAFGVVLVLPGARLADRMAGPRGTPTLRVVLSIAWSQILIALTGVALVAVGRFSGLAVAVVAVALSIAGVPVAARWLRDVRRRLQSTLATVGWIGLLGAPWIGFTGLTGWPPADTLQWYYAGLGTQLGAAGGIPVSVAEWGLSVRWLSDYLVFNIDSEAYLGLLSFLPRADALAAFRVPVAILGLALVVVVLRLWIGRAPAIAGAAAIAGTTFFLAKFDAYKPEALGVALGLAACWLVVRGLRGARSSWVLLGGATLGVALSVHVIAATVMGLLVAGFAGAEWLFARRGRWVTLGWLVRAAALGLLISVAMGLAVQGRATVGPSASNPVIIAGEDPTWTFFLRSTGTFDEPAPPPPTRPLAGGVSAPWAGLKVTSAFGWWLIPVTGIGMLLLVGLGGRRGRSAAVGLAGAGAAIGTVALYFAIHFDTYVPRWTGLVRFGQYAPLLAGLGVAISAAGYLQAWSWLAERRVPRALPIVVALVGIAWLVPTAAARYRTEARIPASGTAALTELRSLARPGDVVLSNALTTGTIEWFTGLEAPLEGRQPLIEDPAFLAATNQLLGDAHAWFAAPSGRALLDRLGVHWVLIVDSPALLGAPATLGGGTAAMGASPDLREAWAADGVALFEVVGANDRAGVHDSRAVLVDVGRTAAILAVAAMTGLLLVAPRRLHTRLRGWSPRPRAQPPEGPSRP